MELTLTNFRCWEDKHLSIPSSGICLINGRSGRGKSSILNSILYAVTGKLKNITTISKKSTKVTLKIDNVTITRSRGPNKLVLKKEDKIYENDEAQGIINDIFGSEFSNTSYIDQDNIYSFVFLSPSDKMEFLEKLLLHNYNIEKMRDNIRSEISKTKTDYTTEESKMNTLDVLLSKTNRFDYDNFYIDGFGKDDKLKITSLNYNKVLDKIKNNQEISEKNVKLIKLKIKKLEEEYDQFLKVNEKISNIKILKENPIYIEFIKYEDEIYCDLLSLEESKNYYTKNKELIRLKEKYNELSKKRNSLKDTNEKEVEKLINELSEVEKDIKDINKISRKRVSDLEKCIELIDILSNLDEKLKDNKDFEDDIQKENEILENNKDILTKKQKLLIDIEKLYTCPSCTTTLKISDNKLVLSSINNKVVDSIVLKEEIESLKSDIKKSESFLYSLKKQQIIYQQTEEQYNDLFDKLDNLRGNVECDKDDIIKEINLIMKHMDISKKMQRIKDDKMVQDIEKDMKEIESKINDIKDPNPKKEIRDENEYTECIEKISKLKQFISLNSKIKSLQEDIGDFKSSDKCYQELLFSERERLENYTKKIENYKVYIDQLVTWDRIRNMKESIEESSKKKQYLSDRLRCLVKIRDHIKTSEQKCISDFINSLNNHASIYIEQFFPDEDIKVELKTTQETKSTGKEKVSLNFELTYRQINGDLSYLSGGERDRVNLAFTLAFSEIINNRVLLLDECISSLDSETTNIILENLKEKYKGKLVILVSHQANLGFFDKVIEI